MFRQGEMRERHESRKMEEKEVYMLISSTCKSNLATLTIMVILWASVPQWHMHYITLTGVTVAGATENAGVENAIRSKLQGWKMQEWKKQE